MLVFAERFRSAARFEKLKTLTETSQVFTHKSLLQAVIADNNNKKIFKNSLFNIEMDE